MAIDFTHFKLYDTDILDLLWSRESDSLLISRPEPEDSGGVFDDLQEKDLIYAITQLNYPRIYSLLRKLDHPLCPTDAMAACLCALNGSPKLMNTLLDHCPSLPEFQFRGVGKVSSLLNIAAEFDKKDMLDILLRRGADPNGASCDGKVPVEVAFCNHAYGSLNRLLAIPDLEIPLTDDMLYTWGALTTGDPGGIYFNPCSLWCCQLLLERLSGESIGLFDPLPVPQQLRLGHALYHANFELAAHLCVLRPLTEADAADVLAHYDGNSLDCTLLSGNDMDSGVLSAKKEQEIRFLCQLLHRRPDLLHAPAVRSAVALAALSLPEKDPFLTRWTQQMEAGPVLLPQLPHRKDLFLNGSFFQQKISVDPTFFTRWEQRLGQHLIPTMDINSPAFKDLNPDMVHQILEHIHFVGVPPTDTLSPLAEQILRHAQEDLLPTLLQSDGLLAQEQPHLLLDACHALPAARRNLMLPYIQKVTTYNL